MADMPKGDGDYEFSEQEQDHFRFLQGVPL